MPSFTNTAILSALAAAVSVSAHGFVQSIVINGVEYSGYDVTKFPYQAEVPTVVGWSSTATDLGFVAPDAFGSPDIICHRDSTNAKGHATVAAGDSVFIQWNTWPDSHKGPVLDYLAPCGADGCETVDKTELEFFKIDEGGLIDGSTAPGFYASDEVIDNGLGWMVQIPASIKPGFYVLRHEIIALHSGGDANGAQNYPQCFSLEVTGSGTEEPAGVKGTALYKPEDAGILFNIYRELTDYPIPGPALIAGASAVEQATSAVTATGTATAGNELSPAPTDGGEAGGDTTTTAAPAPENPEATPAPVVPTPGTPDVLPPSGPTKTTEITPGPTDAAPETPGAPICNAKRSTKSKKSKSKKAKRASMMKKARRGAIPRV